MAPRLFASHQFMFDELAAGDGVFGIMPCQKKRDLCWRVWNAERQKYDVTSYSQELKNSGMPLHNWKETVYFEDIVLYNN